MNKWVKNEVLVWLWTDSSRPLELGRVLDVDKVTRQITVTFPVDGYPVILSGQGSYTKKIYTFKVRTR